MASDDRPTDDLKPKRRGKAPTITLEAREIVPETEPAPVPSEAPARVEIQPDAGKAGSPVAAGDKIGSPQAAEAAPTDEAAPAEATVNDESILPDTISGEAATGEPADVAAPEAAPVEQPPVDAAPIPGDVAHPPTPPIESPPEPRPEPQPAPPAGGGFGRLAAAGLVGALITGGLGIAAQIGGYWPGAARQDATALEQRLAALDAELRQVAARPIPAPPPPVDLAPLTRRIEALDTARAGLDTRLAAIERRPAAPAADGSATPAPAPAVDLAPLQSEIDALKTAVEAVAAAQRNAAQAAPVTPPPAPAVDMAPIEARIAALLAPQGARVDAATDRIRALDDEIKAAAAAARALADKVAALEAARSQAGDSGRRAALVVGLAALRGAIERGQPFAAELKSAAALGLPPDAARALEAHAERGLPTTAALAQRFAALAPALVRAAPARATDGSLLDRLSSTAQSLVRIRPVGEAAGDDVPTAVARAEAKLGRGDVAGALADIERLPEPVRALAASWAAEARARVAAETAVRRLTVDATAALTGG